MIKLAPQVTIDTGLDSVPIEILPELVESVVEIS